MHIRKIEGQWTVSCKYSKKLDQINLKNKNFQWKETTITRTALKYQKNRQISPNFTMGVGRGSCQFPGNL